jgi:hypothetical protein
MARSRYDADHDGVCDAAVCQNVRMPARTPQVFVAIQHALAELGIDVPVRQPSDDNDMPFRATTAWQAETSCWGYNLDRFDLAALLRGGDALSQAGADGFTINRLARGVRDPRTWRRGGTR